MRPDLTPAQSRVRDLLRDGLTAKKIAEQLGISVHTANNHTRAIMTAYGIHSRAAIVAAIWKADYDELKAENRRLRRQIGHDDA